MSELNPNHPVTTVMREQWHKVVALLMIHHGQDHVVITENDLKRLQAGTAVVVKEENDGLHLRLVDGETAQRLVGQAGGLPA